NRFATDLIRGLLTPCTLTEQGKQARECEYDYRRDDRTPEAHDALSCWDYDLDSQIKSHNRWATEHTIYMGLAGMRDHGRFDTEKDKAPALVRFTDKPQSGVGNGRPNSHLRVADLTNNWCPATKAMTHYRSSSSVGVAAWNGCPNVITSRNLLSGDPSPPV